MYIKEVFACFKCKLLYWKLFLSLFQTTTQAIAQLAEGEASTDTTLLSNEFHTGRYVLIEEEKFNELQQEREDSAKKITALMEKRRKLQQQVSSLDLFLQKYALEFR